MKLIKLPNKATFDIRDIPFPTKTTKLSANLVVLGVYLVVFGTSEGQKT